MRRKHLFCYLLWVIKVTNRATFAYLQVHCSSSLPALAAPQPDNTHVQGLCADSDRCSEQHKLGCIAQQGFTNYQGHHTGPGLCTFVWPGNFKWKSSLFFFVVFKFFISSRFPFKIIFLSQVLPVLHNPSHEQIGIFSPRVLNSGQKYFLYIEFGAELGEGLQGFYKSTYRTTTGETRSDIPWH